MNVPGVIVAVPVPVLLMDREPNEDEALLFDSRPASRWDENLVGLDVPQARANFRAVMSALGKWWELQAGVE